jgi:hypothetical protein
MPFGDNVLGAASNHSSSHAMVCDEAAMAARSNSANGPIVEHNVDMYRATSGIVWPILQ